MTFPILAATLLVLGVAFFAAASRAIFWDRYLKAGVYEGTVQARLVVDANGSVTRVEIVEARPRRVFDRAVVRALSEWKYNEGAAGRTVTVELAFKAR